MSPADVDAYAASCGIDTTRLRGVKAKARLVQERRERVATIPVLGTTVDVPVRRMHDKRVTDAVNGIRTDDDMAEAMRMLLGDEQWDGLVARCEDEDGAVDNDALGYACAAILSSDELKNF